MNDRSWERIPAEEEKALLRIHAATPEPKKSRVEIDAAEELIAQSIKEVRYIVREYPVSVLVEKYLIGISKDDNELFVPDYQRELIWPYDTQCRFIESILIGLPIPFLFVADVSEPGNHTSEGRLEIVDGVQRIRTLARFMIGNLVLNDLERLNKLNGFTFFDLTPSRQKRFARATLRLIELTEAVSEDVRRDMFDRVNTGSEGLEAVEVRRGIKQGPFLNLIARLARHPMLKQLAPISEASEKRYEYEELVTRFFALVNRYDRFGTGPDGKVVRDFLMSYVDDTNAEMTADPSIVNNMEIEFERLLKFAEKYYPNGFQKKGRGRRVPRVRFEALAVGAGLALREIPELNPHDIEAWLDKLEFNELTTSDASNNRKALIGRIEFVRDKLLNAC